MLKNLKPSMLWQRKVQGQMNRLAKSWMKQSESGPVSKLFGVSPRAIRDIWNRRTWAYVTKRLWSLETLPHDPGASSHNDASISSRSDTSIMFRHEYGCSAQLQCSCSFARMNFEELSALDAAAQSGA